jgi:NAD(P)-dependent dehydrogenase (short-subunit alcohol dehydrogenase family)
MRTLVHGTDPGLEEALRGVGVDCIRDGEADAFVTLGPVPVVAPLASVDAHAWRDRFRIWTAEPFWAFQAWLRDLLGRGASGSWVAVTSTLGAQPFPGGGADGAAAVALQTLVRVAAAEYGERGLRANAIAAGWRESTLPEELDRSLALADTPAGRITSDDDLAAAIAWLLSDGAANVNGEVVRVDGGYTITAGSRRDPYTAEEE